MKGGATESPSKRTMTKGMNSMGVAKNQVTANLKPHLPDDIVTHLLDEYDEIKHHLAFRRFRPSELNGGRFAECIVRLLNYVNSGSYTPFGTSLGNGAARTIHNQIEGNTSLCDSLRYFIPRAAWTMMDLRNRRDVGHVGGDVNPNLADALLIGKMADWIMTELLRIYYSCSMDAAQKIADGLNEIQIPIIAEIDGFVRVQNTKLDFPQKTLAIMYHKHPSRVRDTALFKWTEYSNASAFKKSVLGKLHSSALIHYMDGCCTLLPQGIAYVEKHIPLELIV